MVSPQEFASRMFTDSHLPEFFPKSAQGCRFRERLFDLRFGRRHIKMRKLTFSTTINAPKEKVWRVMLEDPTYRQWTSVFHEGSYALTDWAVGSKALFLIPEGDGMVRRIVAHRPKEFLSIEPLGT